MTNNKKRIAGFDLVRAFSALSVVIYHFLLDVSVAGNADDRISLRLITLNSTDLGTIAVTLFFALSGALLVTHNHKMQSFQDILKFYGKRARRIYPSFWLVFIYHYAVMVDQSGSFLYAGPLKDLLFSLTGLDGYFFYTYKDYYFFIGDWFLGALILLYLTAPLLILLFQHEKLRIPAFLFLAVCCFINSNFQIFQIFVARNLLTCMLSFYAGMMYRKYRDQIFRIPHLSWICLGILIVLKIMPYWNQAMAVTYLASAAVLIVLDKAGEKLQNHKIWKAVAFIDSISYQMFLLQHVMISRAVSLLSGRYATMGKQAEYLLIVLAAVIFFSWILQVLTDALDERVFRKQRV